MHDLIRVGPLQLRFLKTKHETAGGLDMFEMMVPPDARMPVPHRHAGWDETVYGLEGVTTWTIAGTAVALEPGNAVFIPRDVVHGFENRGTTVTRCLCVLTPGILGPEYFLEMQAAITGASPPDLAVLNAIMQRHGLIPEPA